MPEKRMRAFLKVIRSREATTLMAAQGDMATYQALPDPGKRGAKPPTFDSFAAHPFAGVGAKGSTASGAYGILHSTYKLYVPKWVPLNGTEAKFSPVVQDRIAVAIMEMHPGQGWGAAKYQTKMPTSLALVRKGDIAGAAKQLATVHQTQWTSLPGGAESRGYSTEDLLSDYAKFLAEMD
jgi:muramidase (phage lysozyme)